MDLHLSGRGKTLIDLTEHDPWTDRAAARELQTRRRVRPTARRVITWYTRTPRREAAWYAAWLVLVVALSPNAVSGQEAIDDSVDATRTQAILVDAQPADSNRPVIQDDVTIGLAGGYKAGHWTTLRVPIQTGKDPFRGRLICRQLDPEGVPSEYPSAVISQPGSTERRHVLYVKFGQAANPISLRLEDERGRVLARRNLGTGDLPAPISPSRQWIVSLGDSIGVESALRRRASSQAERVTHTSLAGFQEFPSRWLGYSGIDTLVIATSSLSTDRVPWDALVDWVELGGQCLFCGASKGEQWFAAGQPLAPLLPGSFQGVVQQTQTTGLEQFAGASVRLDRAQLGRVFQVPMAELKVDEAIVVASEGFGNQRRPSIVNDSVGLGRVTFVAFDLDREPCADWADRGKLVDRLLSFGLPSESSTSDKLDQFELGPVAHLGFSDLIGQLRSALDVYAGVKLVPFSWIALLMALYILAVGPLDYWVLKRWHRREWTWLTFGLIVLGFTGLAFGLAQKWKGRALQINQATVVDADYETGKIRGTAWTHLFSARTSRLTVDHQANSSLDFSAPPRVITSWQGLPGTGFGGLDRSDTNALVETAYDISIEPNSFQLRNLPVPVWSSRSLAGLWWGNAKFEPGGVSLSATRDAVVSGEVTNPFPFDLESVHLVYQRWAYPLGTLLAGGTATLTSETGIDMQTLLTQRQVVKGRSLVTPWDQNSKDVNRILQLLLFYDVAKGRAYTQLHHRYQRELDWSRHLTPNQAVLWGTSRESATQVDTHTSNSGELRHWTHFRLLVPVERQGE